jgi:aminocarboxymuconate-semialdehyde decarboxylase
MMLRIDIFSHFSTRELREAYFSIAPGRKGRKSDPLSMRSFAGGKSATDIDVLWDIDQRVKVLDRYGIDIQVLTLSYPMLSGVEPEEELRLAKLANDSLAEMIKKYPGRFVGVATLPFSSPEEAVRELDRSVDTYGFKGFQVSSNINGLPLDSPHLFPIYETAQNRGLPMWIHPTTPLILDIIGTKANLDILFGWPMDTSIALVKLVTSGILEKFPTLKVIVHHLGAGMVPYFIERLDTLLDRGDLGLSKPPSHYWKLMYHDTAAIGANAFTCGYNVFGEDHVVFGVDYPFGRNKGEQFLESRRKIVDNARIDESARRKIYEENARKLLNLV